MSNIRKDIVISVVLETQDENTTVDRITQMAGEFSKTIAAVKGVENCWVDDIYTSMSADRENRIYADYNHTYHSVKAIKNHEKASIKSEMLMEAADPTYRDYEWQSPIHVQSPDNNIIAIEAAIEADSSM